MRTLIRCTLIALYMLGIPVRAATSVACDIPAPNLRDVNCLIVAALLGDSTDEKQRAGAVWVSAYFAGKLYGADPNYDLLSSIRNQMPKLDDAALAALQLDCMKEVQSRVAELSAVGDALVKDKTKHQQSK